VQKIFASNQALTLTDLQMAAEFNEKRESGS
jgi:hypothetical protein